jgi:hypothetical protein
MERVEIVRRRFGEIELYESDDVLLVVASGYVGPSLLREELARAAAFGRSRPRGWRYVVDVSRVRFANPLNFFWLRRIGRLPNVRGYVVIAPSPLARAVLRFASRLVGAQAVVPTLLNALHA